MIPFSDYSSSFWSNLDPKLISNEGLVSKIHTLETLERLSPYGGKSEQYFGRVWRALEFLQQFPEVNNEWLNAAFVIFANVIYLPQALLEDAWRGLYQELLEREFRQRINPFVPEEIRPNIHIFENDPSGMTAAFCHLNKLQGRLDNEKFARVESIDKVADVFLDLMNPEKEATAGRIVQQIYRKRFWIILSDKSLSGHSLASDLRYFLFARQIALRAGMQAPKLVVLCQVMSQTSEDALRKVIKQFSEEYQDCTDGVAIYRAVFLDDACKFNSDNCRLIRNRSLVPAIHNLCRWFAGKFIESNRAFDRMRERSGDSLEFGYRGSALTVVDYQNCPTNSLPLLWFSSNEVATSYVGPYQRIHSRIGGQTSEPSADKWQCIRDNQAIGSKLTSLLARC